MELVDGQFEQARWGGGQVLLGGGGHGEERVGEQGEGGPLVPGGPAADLVLVQSGQALGGVERLLDPRLSWSSWKLRWRFPAWHR